MKLDKRACRHAANAPLNISLNAGVLYTDRVKYLVTAAVKLLGGHRALAVYFYECERLKANDRMPKWVVFQGKDDFVTLERDAEGNVKWRDSMLENLVDESFYKFRESCVFYKGTDGVAISDFIHQSASGITILEALQVYQYGIRNKQAKKLRCKRDMGIVEKMKKVPAAPSNLARWIDRNVMPHYLFYSYDRNQPETQVFCTYCEKFSVIKKPKTGKIFVCPQCKQKAIAKAQGRRAAYHEDRETCQVIQKISDEELLIRIFKARWAYTVYENFETALRAATADYARIPNEYRLDTIRQYGGIKCAPGQKASRIINRLCLKFHLDQIEEEAEAGEPDNRYMRTVKPYNALFARLADALNPAHIEKTAVLSIHPCDFLEMSNRDNTWSSCHCLEGGGYRGGCQSYMGDAVSMIFFTVSDEYTQDFHTAPRITREIFCYKDNVLLQSRLYPTDLEDQKTLYRSIVQQAVATCLDKPNLWSIKRGKETEPYCESAADSNHYPDYAYGYAVASLLKGETDYGKMTIGSVARCVCCGGEQKNHRSIRCAECGNMYVCKGCGKTVHGYGRYIDNHFYCNECSYECTVCREKFIGMPRIGIARSGEQRGICPACYEQVVSVCRNCTIHGDCLSIGANRFCPNQMNDLAA